MSNAAIINPTVMGKTFNKVMLEWEEKLHGKLASLVSCINCNID
jgi:hypothetical protein